MSMQDVVRTAHKFTEGLMLETSKVIKRNADAHDRTGRCELR